MIDKDAKFLVISTSCLQVPPDNYGGVEQMVYNLCYELGNRGYDVTCAAPAGTSIDNVEVIETIEPDDSKNCFMREPEAYYEYSNRLSEFDVIIDHSWHKISYLHKAENPELMKDTVILGVWHGMPSVEEKPPVQHPNYLSVSDAASKAWKDHTGLEVRTAYNGIMVDDYPLRDDHYADGDFILTLNRIMPEKGIDLFCEVGEKLEENYVVAGEDRFIDNPGYAHDIMKTCAESDYGTYLGAVSHEQKIDLIQRAKAVVLMPTRGYQEVFGLAAPEAAACGTPPVVLDNNGLGEICKTINFRLVCDDKCAVAAAIKGLDNGTPNMLSPEEYRQKVIENFSSEAMTDMYLNRVQEALKSPWGT